MKDHEKYIRRNRVEQAPGNHNTIPEHDLLHVPGSINIPEILEYLEDADFEDWLTAAFFENASRMPLRHLCAHGAYRF